MATKAAAPAPFPAVGVSPDAEALLQARLLTDERYIRPAALKALPLVGTSASAELSPDDLVAASHTYAAALDAVYLNLNKGKARAVYEASVEDAAAYEAGIATIEADRARANDDIVSLRARLAEAQTMRKNKIQYDALAKDIGKVPSRDDSREHIERLTNEIDTLLQEQTTYTETWSFRKARFDEIVAALATLTGDIRKENEEAERKRALDQDEEDDDGRDGKTLDPNAPEFRPGGAPRTDDDAATAMEGVEASAPPAPVVPEEEKEEGEA